MITVKPILQTQFGKGHPVIRTLQLEYPRFIHSEFMTHRAFSRNASSSRAIPVMTKGKVKGNIDRLLEEGPQLPERWGVDEPGMQASRYMDDAQARRAIEVWTSACTSAIQHAREMAATGAHKQHVNRILEPYLSIAVVVTATEWDNFLTLRDHEDADPTIHVLASRIRQAIDETPVNQTDWHLPYLREEDWEWDEEQARIPIANAILGDQFFRFNRLAMVSGARCARVSYFNHDGSPPDIRKDLDLSTRLLGAKHMSPFEHQAWARPDPRSACRNLVGWTSFRAITEGGEDW